MAISHDYDEMFTGLQSLVSGDSGTDTNLAADFPASRIYVSERWEAADYPHLALIGRREHYLERDAGVGYSLEGTIDIEIVSAWDDPALEDQQLRQIAKRLATLLLRNRAYQNYWGALQLEELAIDYPPRPVVKGATLIRKAVIRWVGLKFTVEV